MARIALLGLIVCLSVAGISGAALAGEVFTTYPSDTGVRPGTGWDAESGTKTIGACVTGQVATDPGQHRSVYYAEVSDIASAQDALSVSSDEKIHGILGASADIAVSLSKSIKLDTNDLFITVNARVLNGPRYLVPPGLPADAVGNLIKTLDAAAELAPSHGGSAAIRRMSIQATIATVGPDAIDLKPEYVQMAIQDPISFRKYCGDAYVSTVGGSASINGIYTVATRNLEEKSSLSGRASGSIAWFSGDATANHTLDDLNSSSRISVQYVQVGGDGTPIATNDKDFRALVSDLGVKANQPGTPTTLGYTRYDDLPSYHRPTTPVQLALQPLADQYFRLLSLYDALDQILENQKDYSFDGPISVSTTKALQDGIKSEMTLIYQTVTQCADASATCPPVTVAANDDYAERAWMPVRLTDIQNWNTQQDLQTQLAAAKAKLNVTPPTVTGPCHWEPGGEVHVRIFDPHAAFAGGGPRVLTCPAPQSNPDYASLQALIAALTSQIATLGDPTNSRETRYKVWFEIPEYGTL